MFESRSSAVKPSPLNAANIAKVSFQGTRASVRAPPGARGATEGAATGRWPPAVPSIAAVADETSAGVDLDEVVARMQARVAERRRSGAYPPGLESALDEHFRRIVAHRASRDFTRMRARLAALDERSRFGVDRIPAASQRPGGQALHAAVARVVARQTSGVLDQVQHYAEGVREVLVGLVESLEDPDGHVHGDLVGQLDAVLERLASAERRAVAAEAALAALAARVEALESAAPPDR